MTLSYEELVYLLNPAADSPTFPARPWQPSVTEQDDTYDTMSMLMDETSLDLPERLRHALFIGPAKLGFDRFAILSTLRRANNLYPCPQWCFLLPPSAMEAW